jgi:anti-anti-sigma factor
MLKWISTEPTVTRISLTEAPSDFLVTRLMRCGRTVWLQLRGALNWRTADQLRHALENCVSEPCRRVVLDLTEVEYVGGDVLHLLVETHERLALEGVELRLVAPDGSRCARSVALTGLDVVIPTFSGAIAAWRHRHGRG